MNKSSENADANEQATTRSRATTKKTEQSRQGEAVSKEGTTGKAKPAPASRTASTATAGTPARASSAGSAAARPVRKAEQAAATSVAPAPQQAATTAQRSAAASRTARATTGAAARNGGTAAGPQHAPSTQRPAQPSQPVHGSQNGQHSQHPQTSSTHPSSGTRTAVRGGAAHPGAARPSGSARAAHPAAPAQRPSERRVSPVKEKPTGPISIPAQIVVKDLADLLQATPNEVISDLIKKHSVFANINQVIDYDKAALVAQDLGFEPTQSVAVAAPAVQRQRENTGALQAAKEGTEEQKGLVSIPPVVTIMGHVDHGKTTLLDTIRKTKVAASEVGGITQHIGAYQVEVQGKKITFLDTPGHEAFTAMRARGAQVTHIAVIVVAADDGVMPQTREAIDHARAANVPIIIALNKMDKPDANPDYVKQQLAEIGVVVEDYGGDVICVPVSARKGTGIDDLLEMILLLAEIQDIKGDPNQLATGTIIEAKLEKNSGPTATVLVANGTLKMGDNIVVGTIAGKVRAMFNDRGKRIQKAPPSTPVSILGLPEVPQAGDHLEAIPEERTARQIATQLAEQRRSESRALGQVSLDTLYTQMQQGSVKELNIVLKSDVQGSAEAIKHALTRVGDENLKVRLIHEGVGNISETDVHLAGASGAIIIGFNVRADGAAQRLAQEEGVDIRYYNIIYKLLDDIEAALTGMLEPTYREVVEGHAEIQQTFKAGKNIMIAGCRVLDGKITRSSRARLLRNQERVWDGKIASLRRGKDDVREVASGYECGILFEDYNGFEIGDIVETYAQEKVKPGA